MISESERELDNVFLACPFTHSCNLPKVKSLCNFPDYKQCRDYEIKLQKLKASMKILH